MDSLYPGSESFGGSTPLTQEAVSVPKPAQRVNEDTPGFLDGVGAGIMNETEFGAAADAVSRSTAPVADPDYDFNPFAYARGMKDKRRQGIAQKLLANGAFDRVRGEYHTADDVETLIDQYDDEMGRRATASGSASSMAGYMAGSFVSLSSAVPFVGVAAKASAAAKAGQMALSAGASSAVLEAGLYSAQVTRTPEEVYLNIGVSTALGGGIGVMSHTLTNKALRKKIAGALDVMNTPEDIHGMGAASNPGPTYNSGNTGDLGSEYLGWRDRLPVWSWLMANPTSTTYKMAASGANYTADLFRRMGVNGPGEGHKLGHPERVSVEDLADVDYTTKANDAENLFNAHKEEFIATNPDVDPQDFNLTAAMMHEFPEYTSGNKALDDAARQAVHAQGGSNHFFNKMYDDLNEHGVFPKNQVEEFRAAVEKAKQDLAAAEKTLAQTPSGKPRKEGTKVHERAVKRVNLAVNRLAKVEKANTDRRNYFTQAWQKVGLLEHRAKVVDILERQFRRASSTTEKDIERVFREMAPEVQGKAPEVDEDALLDALMAFEEGGTQALPENIQVALATNKRNYLRPEAEKLVDDLQQYGIQGLNMIDSDIVKSSRVRGRKIHLDEDTTKELMQLGVLNSDPVKAVRSYNSQVGPVLAMKRVLGFHDDAGFQEVIRQARKEITDLEDAGKISKDESMRLQNEAFGTAESGRGTFHVMKDRVLNKTGFDDAGNGALAWGGSQMMKYNYVTTLGGMAISAVTDLATMSIQAGITKNPAIYAAFTKNLLKANIKNVQRLSSREMRQLLLGIENYNAFNGRSAQLGGALTDPTKSLGFSTGAARTGSAKIEGGGNIVAEKFTELTGMAQWNRAAKHTSMQFLMMQMHDIGSGVVQMSPRMVEDYARWGLTKTDLEYIAKQAADDFDGIKYPNPDKWPASAQARELKTRMFVALKRAGDEAVVTVRRGDKPTWMDTPVGRMVGQFTSFSHAWHSRVGRRNMKHGFLPRDAEAYGFMGQSIAYGTLAYILKESIKGNDLPDPTTPEGLRAYIGEGIDRGGLLAQMTAPANGFSKLASSMGVPYLPQASRFEGRNALNAFAGPTLGKLGDITEFAYGVGDATPDKIAMKAYRLVPFNNVFYLDYIARRTLLDK